MASPPGRAWRTGQPVYIEDFDRAPEVEHSDLLREHNVHALVNVPIKLDGVTFGVLEADSDAARRFTADDKNFLSGFANLVAAAVARTRHDADMRAAAREREELLAELQRAKAAAEAAASKSRLLAAAGHDLKQPLQSIVLSLDLLGTRLSDPRDRERVACALRAAQQLERTFDRLLDVARLETSSIEPRPTTVPVQRRLATLAETFEPAAQAKGPLLRIVPSGARIRSDPDLLERMLQNLVGNAVKYTDAGNRGRVLIGCRRCGSAVSIEIHDNGLGMTPEQVEMAFQEFCQLDPAPGSRGLGLGLSIVRRLADLPGHRIIVRSRAGKGVPVSALSRHPSIEPQRRVKAVSAAASLAGRKASGISSRLKMKAHQPNDFLSARTVVANAWPNGGEGRALLFPVASQAATPRIVRRVTIELGEVALSSSTVASIQ